MGRLRQPIFSIPHSYYISVPILGDTLYSRKPIDSTIADATVVPNNRIFLHSSEISFFVRTSSTSGHSSA